MCHADIIHHVSLQRCCQDVVLACEWEYGRTEGGFFLKRFVSRCCNSPLGPRRTTTRHQLGRELSRLRQLRHVRLPRPRRKRRPQHRRPWPARARAFEERRGSSAGRQGLFSSVATHWAGGITPALDNPLTLDYSCDSVSLCLALLQGSYSEVTYHGSGCASPAARALSLPHRRQVYGRGKVPCIHI